MAYYAWGEIKHSHDGKTVEISRGQKVEKKDLPGISDGDWDELIAGGSIRNKQFPAPEGYQGSAIDYLRESLQEAQAVSPVDEEEAVLDLAGIEPTPPEEIVAAPQHSTGTRAKK